jgi:hypothetical protein
MRPLRYAIDVTLDGCCHHEAGLPADDESMRYWTAGMEPSALADFGLIDEYEFVVHPIIAGHGPTLLAGLRERIELELVDRQDVRSGEQFRRSLLPSRPRHRCRRASAAASR